MKRNFDLTNEQGNRRLTARKMGLKYVITVALAIVLTASLCLPASPAYAIDAPTPLSPASGVTSRVTEYPPLAIPTFSWSEVASATAYKIQFSQTIGFSSIQWEATTAHTTYTPPNGTIFSDGDWYWRVRTEAPQMSNYSAPMYFKKEWASATNRPTLVSPANGAAIDFYTSPSFTWQAVLGASSYRFQIATDTSFSSSTLKFNETTLATSYQPSYKLSNGIYYWRVVPLDPGNREGTPSETRSFTSAYGSASFTNEIPTLLEPANNPNPTPGNPGPTFTPTFRWTAVIGAQKYRLQYSTDPTFASAVNTVETNNTAYTPQNALPNDVNYYWRVQAISNQSVGDWSQVWSFRKQWYLQPTILTPTDGYQLVRMPLFSWTPVPGASYYKTELANNIGFQNPLIEYTSNTFYTPQNYNGGESIYYFRVTPYDQNGNAGKESRTSSYRSSASFNAPELIYPLYYYQPSSLLNPHEDRTVSLPLFMWHRTFEYPLGIPFSDAFRIQVSSDPLFLTVDWTVDTQNLVAAPTAANNFTPAAGVDYYWRVCPISNFGAPCLRDPGSNLELWSQIWKTRIDLSRGLAATPSDQPPQLVRPADASEYVEMTPAMEWKPVTGADSYEVQISTDPNFSTGYTIDTATVTHPVYAPVSAFAQRNLDKTDYGVFYWRVRALQGGTPLSGGWSAPNRFQVASQSQWWPLRGLGHIENQLPIGDDTDGDVDPNFDLTTLYATQDANYWYFGFDATATTANMTYVLYLDIDHKQDSGGTTDPRGYTISTVDGYLPEVVIYVIEENGELTPDKVAIYRWNGAGWDTPQLLSAVGGDTFPSDLYDFSLVPDSDSGWAVGQYGNILYWSGSSWLSTYSPTTTRLNAVSMYSSNYGWAVGDRGTMLRYNGSSWSAISPAVVFNLHSVSAFALRDGWAVGENGTMLRWNGAGWGAASAVTTKDLYGVSVITSTIDTNKTIGWAVGESGTILRLQDNVWSNFPNTFTDDLRSVSTFNDNDAWAVGDNGTILHWTGSNWSKLSHSLTSQNLLSVFARDANDIWVVGTGGVILHGTGPAPANWSLLTSPSNLTLYAVNTNASNYGIIIGENGANLRWNGSAWTSIRQPLTDYIELMLPNTPIGMQATTGSYAAALLTVAYSGGGLPKDSIPEDALITTSGVVRFLTNVSERYNLRFPFNNVEGLDTTTYPSILPFFWDYSIGAPWAGAHTEAYKDSSFTTRSEEFYVLSNSPIYAPPSHAWADDFDGDNSYYWRVQPRYLDDLNNVYWGAWSQGSFSDPTGASDPLPTHPRFERQGLVPQNLRESVTFATPTFYWDIVEGASSYDLQVDDDISFASPLININTTQTSYTPQTTFDNGTYYWRVRVRRYHDVYNDWTTPKSFTLTLPVPTGLSPNDPGGTNPVHYAPTFCWNHILSYSGNDAVLSAWRYRVQVSKNPTFPSNEIYDGVDTEQNCWTPTRGYADGTYYWRVAMMDGNNRLSAYSAVAQFTKQYPVTTLVSPLSGDTSPTTPTFVWTPVNGALRYKLEISTVPNFSALYDSVETNNTRYTPLTRYANGSYYWRVAIIDRDNNYGPFTDATLLIGVDKRIFLPLVKR